MDLNELLETVAPPDEAARDRARERWNALAKPLGSLGVLETMVEDIAALTGSEEIDVSDRAVLALCADNGVT
ncbi:MAG: nicotinate-nucleotide--dimethylbenzimidazole phosphoribosyltransferase, partial [Oscillibacter sp.]|nr:nicotinate-nucleotide--dimethylbenzimidazole phosphoribosyltransferase [Oscillibacter sp.]